MGGFVVGERVGGVGVEIRRGSVVVSGGGDWWRAEEGTQVVLDGGARGTERKDKVVVVGWRVVERAREVWAGGCAPDVMGGVGGGWMGGGGGL